MSDILAEVERLTTERDEARAEVERLSAEVARITDDRDSWENEAAVNDALAREQLDAMLLQHQRDFARQEFERLRTELVEQDNELDAAREDVLRLTSERDMARAEVQRLIAERDQTATHPKGREVGRFGLDGHYLDAMEPARPSDEDIWREAFMVLLRKTSYAWERASEEADRVLAEYRKRWPR